MTDMTPEQQELEALRTHNAELLAELRKVKTALKEHGEEAAQLVADRDAKAAALHKMQLDDPVDDMMDWISPLPGHLRAELEKTWQFAATDDGIQIQDKKGKPAILEPLSKAGKPSAAQFTPMDILQLCRQSGRMDVFGYMLKNLGHREMQGRKAYYEDVRHEDQEKARRFAEQKGRAVKSEDAEPEKPKPFGLR